MSGGADPTSPNPTALTLRDRPTAARRVTVSVRLGRCCVTEAVSLTSAPHRRPSTPPAASVAPRMAAPAAPPATAVATTAPTARVPVHLAPSPAAVTAYLPAHQGKSASPTAHAYARLPPHSAAATAYLAARQGKFATPPPAHAYLLGARLPPRSAAATAYLPAREGKCATPPPAYANDRVAPSPAARQLRTSLPSRGNLAASVWRVVVELATALLFALIHRSAWNRNSRKFAANSFEIHRLLLAWARCTTLGGADHPALSKGGGAYDETHHSVVGHHGSDPVGGKWCCLGRQQDRH